MTARAKGWRALRARAYGAAACVLCSSVTAANYAELDRWPAMAGVWEMNQESLRTASAGMLKPPLKPDVAAGKRSNPQNEPLPKVLCAQDGMPNIMGDPELLEITFTKGKVLMVTEGGARVMRRISMDGSPKPDTYYPQLAGYSTGRWEGDTLVIDTSEVDAEVELGGVRHGPNLRILERFRLLSPTLLHSETIVTDPDILSGPWKVERTYEARPHDRLYEYICNQNNREVLDDQGVQHVDLTPPK
ncbi:MAG: hypothetical protein QM718_05110 [Steroidobacteraceae bacterium]